jgi:hypothetical protein
LSSVPEDIVNPSSHPNRMERATAEQLVRLANTTSRRSFLAWVGRASVALLGGTFLQIWRSESASASACIQAGNQFPATGRLSCMCSEVTGSNSCPNCCSGWWLSCLTNDQDPAACWSICSHTPPMVKYKKVRLWDCCAECAGQADPSKAGCSFFGDNWCATSATAGYCDEGNCCGPGSPGGSCSTWRVKCVVKECTTTFCTGCVPN